MILSRFLLIIFIFSPTVCFASNDIYENEKADKPRPYKITYIKSLTIDPEHYEAPDLCSKFILSPFELRDFFRKAHRVSKKKYSQDLYMSRCYRTGKMIFANKDRGEWEIDRARRGLIRFSDGRILYFYCPDCKTSPFDKAID
jgi:hypothetical protein